MLLKIKEFFVLITLVAFIVFINMQTGYVDVSVDTVIEAVYDDAGLSDMSEYSATELKKDYGININDYNGVAYYGYESVMDCETLLVVCLKDKSQGDAIINTITAKREELIKLFQSYAPDQYELLRNSILVQKDKYILYIVSDNAKAVESDFMECITE